ncbi:transcriptional regulator [Propioniciclava sp.]|uniref:transcriptional regulator n=1 Tax=Propioniciclava sp. TaxID=2038686 RepID=UPI00261E92F5|nr:transcriptional regulator [Propioniciclava sp.]
MIDPVIHAPARLAIVTTLATLAKGDALRFPALQSITELTAGNLTTHVRKLEDAGYVVVRTSGRGRASSTTIALTPSGRSAFAAYRAELLRLLEGDLS